MPSVRGIIEYLYSISSKWYIHEEELCRMLGIRNRDGESTTDKLNAVLTAIETGTLPNEEKTKCKASYPGDMLQSTSIPNEFIIVDMD